MSRHTNHSEAYKFIHHFIPHPYHNTRAKLLSHTALVMYSMATIVLLGVISVLPKVYPGVLGYASDIRVKELFEVTNQVREEAGLDPLRLNATLTKAAKRKAEHMFSENYWAHISPTGVEPWYFILDSGYDYSYAGENLAKNFNTSKEVVAAWYQSPTHRDNLLSPNYDEVGYAVVDGVLEGYETTLVVQMFGRPRNESLVTTESEQASLLEEIEQIAVEKAKTEVPTTAAASSVGAPSGETPVDVPAVLKDTPSENSINLPVVMKVISLAFGVFLVVLLAIDIYHTKKKGILKFTGHTYAHMMFIIALILVITFVIKPGTIL